MSKENKAAHVQEERDGMFIEWDVPIEMDDGLCLRADVFRPLAPDILAPVILSHGPYAKGLHFQDGYPDEWEIMCALQPDAVAGTTSRYANWEVVDPEKWVADGYACVRVDSRGAGRSPGFIQPFSPRETWDFFHCIEWAGTQAWCNGKVGLSGISYYAINQWQVAALQPPHLAAICTWEGAADWYRDATHHGGIRSTFWANWWEHQVRSVQFGLGARGPTSRANGTLVCGDETLPDEELARSRTDLATEIQCHPLIDDYYGERIPNWENVTVPLLSAGNWGGHGLHLRGNTEGFVRAASSAKWLELHGLDHWTQYYADSGRLLQKRFFDFFLKGEANGWDDQPRVQLNIRHVDGTFRVRFEDGWPIPRTQWTTLSLSGSDRRLSLDAVPAEERTVYAASGDGLTFLTDVLEHEIEISGPAAAKLFVSSLTPDADIFVTLRLFDRAGDEVMFQGSLEPRSPLAHGWLRASHRELDDTLSTPFRPVHTHARALPLEVGRVYELDVEIWPTCVVIPAGYKLGVTVGGRDYEHEGVAAQLGWCTMTGVGPFKHDDPLDRPPSTFDNEVALHTGGAYPSSILLPVVPPT